MKTLRVIVAGLAISGAIAAAAAIAVSVLWWVSLIAIRRIPMIGKRHRHSNWERLNRG
jgi:hypothetical protein